MIKSSTSVVTLNRIISNKEKAVQEPDQVFKKSYMLFTRNLKLSDKEKSEITSAGKDVE